MPRFFTALAVVILTCLPAQAQPSYPDYYDIHVNDFASLMSVEEQDVIRATLAELRDKRGIEFTVVTIRSFWDYGYDGRIEPFATGLFNYWGVGDAGRNDGVMMLVARDDRVMRIELGAGYGREKDAQMKDIIDSVILPPFRDGDYATGIQDGVNEVILNLTGSWPGEYDSNSAQRFINSSRRFLGGFGNWLYALLAPVGFFGFRGYRRYRRNKPRMCPVDGSRMHKIDEALDDAYLKKGQTTEEDLKSVDYDVWKCSRCDHVTIEGYKAWFSGYGACRSCGFRTVEGDSTVIQAATKSSTGLRRVEYHCHNCQDTWSTTEVIPQITESSSSSSSSSFGGGSSSGGGASGSW